MKIWLNSGAVRDVAPIKQKRRELEEKARIQRIDDRFESDLLIYGNKMDKFTNLNVPIMRQQLSSASSAVLPAADHRILCGIYRDVCKELKVIPEANVSPELGKYLHDIIPSERRWWKLDIMKTQATMLQYYHIMNSRNKRWMMRLKAIQGEYYYVES